MGAIGLAAGIAAGSIALTGWALVSSVEGLASMLVVWRFTGHARCQSRPAGGLSGASRPVSGCWPPYIAIDEVRDLAGERRAAVTVVGIVLTVSSVVIMPVLGIAKQRLGRRLGSDASAGEGIQQLMWAA